ncbi:MAG: SusD/RagB family nutrient-binding outer membrane lipoprotein [Chitinophagaceae bacterium]
MKLSYIKMILLFSGLLTIASCKKKLDINYDPDRIPDSNSPIAQLLTAAQVNLGFEGGSDLFRYTTLIMQHMSGGASQANQTWDYYRYNITGSDQNNVWGSIHAQTLSDLQLIIKQGAASPYYSGIAKILKAYEYSLVVDVWGDVPYTEAQFLTANTQPHYDDDAVIYPKLISLLTEAITDLNATSSVLTPGTNSVIYTNTTFATARAMWIKLANTLKLRLLLHYSKKDPAFTVAQITALVNTPGITFFASNTDNLQVNFYNVSGQRNPISAFEVSRPNYLFADRSMVNLMLSKTDPRLPFYFAIFPFSFTPFSVSTSAASSGNTLTFAYTNTIISGMTVTGGGIGPNTIVKSVAHTPATLPTTTTITLNDDETVGYAIPSIPAATAITFQPAYRGVSAAKPPIAPNNNYSRIHTFLRGAITAGVAAPAPYTGAVQPFTYSGDRPQRMISFAEYNFIRAEAALMGAPGTAQTFFTDGITASMQEVGATPAEITAYLTTNGTLIGTNAQKLRQIIEEKYVASFGVSVEPWTDWRRTGYPIISAPANAVLGTIPRTLFYPQTEIDLNPNNPGQKDAGLQGRVFWDN